MQPEKQSIQKEPTLLELAARVAALEARYAISTPLRPAIRDSKTNRSQQRKAHILSQATKRRPSS